MLLIQLYFPLQVTVQDHVLQQELVLRKHSFLKLRISFLIPLLEGVELVHELHFLQIEGSPLLVIFQEDPFLVLKELIFADVVFHEIVEGLEVLASQRNFEVSLVPFSFLLDLLGEVVEVHHFTFLKPFVLQVA